MTDDHSQKIVDAISRKEKFTIRILKQCNENGEINISLDPAFKPRRIDASFCIALVNFATTNLVANVTTSNNKFYYHNGTAEKSVTVPSGFWLIKSYNEEVKRLIKENKDQDDAINIGINDSTGLVTITLAKSYNVLFSKNNTFRDQLGFEATDLRGNGNHVASKVCNLWPTQSIYIHCSLVRGNKKITNKGCVESDIIYDFPCNFNYGAPITYQLSPRLTESDLDLSTGQIDKISLRFTDDKGKPVTFGNSDVSMALRIYQV
jgi:hypothetical protein